MIPLIIGVLFLLAISKGRVSPVPPAGTGESTVNIQIVKLGQTVIGLLQPGWSKGVPDTAVSTKLQVGSTYELEVTVANSIGGRLTLVVKGEAQDGSIILVDISHKVTLQPGLPTTIHVGPIVVPPIGRVAIGSITAQLLDAAGTLLATETVAVELVADECWQPVGVGL